jgi:hypothetical protein
MGYLYVDFHLPPSPSDHAGLFANGGMSVPSSGMKKMKARIGSSFAADIKAKVHVGDIHGAMAMNAKFPPRGRFAVRVVFFGT